MRHLRPARLRFSIIVYCILTCGSLAAWGGVIVPGLASSQLDPQPKGQVLIEELNCAACHASEAAFVAASKKGPRLALVCSRVSQACLAAFIRDPHGTKPGTTMPDVLASRNADEKAKIATEITHFLLSLKKNDFSLQPTDAVAAQQGERLFHSRGCAACHSPRDAKGTELLPITSVPLGALEKKLSAAGDEGARPSRLHDVSRPGVGRTQIVPKLSQRGQDRWKTSHWIASGKCIITRRC